MLSRNGCTIMAHINFRVPRLEDNKGCQDTTTILKMTLIITTLLKMTFLTVEYKLIPT